MSASSRPTDAPSAASASARLTAVVDLPTPPLPDATAMMFFTFGITFRPRCTACDRILLVTLTLTLTTPGSLRSASTTAVNLALALAAEGATVGLLDADIYGPSQPMMLGIAGRPESKDGKHLEPMEAYGVQAMSIGFLIDIDTPMVWRGPMVTQALEQLLKDTNWREVDYLVVDLPPGTGDIQLTLAQKVPVTGAVIVTTPQDIALIDAKKGLKMFEKVGVPILGIVENMAIHICSHCGHAEHIFGSGGGQRMADQYSQELLGSLPLALSIREQADSGKPTVVAEPDGPHAQAYRQIARKIAVKLAGQAKDYSSKFPTITISKNT